MSTEPIIQPPARKLARVETILALAPIVGADRIEVATVGGWKVVTQKGLYKVGDLVCYFELDSLIPRRPWSLFLFKDNRELYRLKSVRLKGQISQGLLVPLSEITELTALFGDLIKAGFREGDDLTHHLSIIKWEPEISAQLAGKIKGQFPSFLRKTDEPRLQSNKGVLEDIKGLSLIVTLKLDGSSFTAYKQNGEFGVCSRNLDLREDGGDTYWATAKAYDLPNKLPEGYAIQAEMVGPGIQGNKLGLKTVELFVFNVWDIQKGEFLSGDTFYAFLAERGLKPAPIAITMEANWLGWTMDQWIEYASSVQYPNGTPAEGIVIRPTVERYSPALNSRLSFKVISNTFLLKYGE